MLLSEFDYRLLTLINRGEGKWSWYDIGTRLVFTGASGEKDMMEALKDLVARGLVKRYITLESPFDRWEITRLGEAALATEICNRSNTESE